MNPKTIALDEEGYFILSDGLRLTDAIEGKRLLARITVDENGGVWTEWDSETLIVEPFDKPYVAQQIEKVDEKFFILMPYGFTCEIVLSSLCLDAWDRFHGLTVTNVPFVLTRKAQAEFFNLVDEFDDESLTISGKKLSTPDFYLENNEVTKTSFWTEKYSVEEPPRWDLKQHHPALEAILPQIKINKCRILNLGCGRGHDAAYLARLGHVVTAVDFSELVISQAQQMYAGLPNLSLKVGDALDPKGFPPSDLIFEHTLFCAISPLKRKALIQQWKRSLDERGHLLGIFFVHPKRGGPPYGGSEWELRELLEKDFRLLYWKRWPLSPAHRIGTELVIYAQKK